MLYLENTTDAQILFIPKAKATSASQLTLRVQSTIDLAEYFNSTVLDLDTSALYFNVSLALPADMPDGEYAYTLEGGGEVLSSGLLIVGSYENVISQYNKDIEYEQYEN